MFKLTKKNFYTKSEDEKKQILLSNFTSMELAQMVIELSDKKVKITDEPKAKKMKISKSEFDKYFEFSIPRKRKNREDKKD